MKSLKPPTKTTQDLKPPKETPWKMNKPSAPKEKPQACKKEPHPRYLLVPPVKMMLTLQVLGIKPLKMLS
jgi:hypothetical protein